MITDWHHEVAKAYAKANHGHVNELRKNKANMTLTGYAKPQFRKYWEMETWLIRHGVIIDVRKEKPKKTPQSVIDKLKLFCRTAKAASGGLLKQ